MANHYKLFHFNVAAPWKVGCQDVHVALNVAVQETLYIVGLYFDLARHDVMWNIAGSG